MAQVSERSPAMVALGAVFPLLILFVSALSVVLAAGAELNLSPGQLSAWIAAGWGVGGVLGAAMSAWYRQPLLFTGNIAGLIFLASMAREIRFAEMMGGTIVAGLVVLAIGIAGLTPHVARLVPMPIIWGLIAGAVTPFVSRAFTAIGPEPALAGSALVAYIVSLRLWGTRFPAVFSAVVVGMIVAGVMGEFGPAPAFELLSVELTTPTFTAAGILGVAPVFIALMTLQANIPSNIYLRSQGYDPPARAIDVVSGVGTVGASLLGPAGMSVAFIGMPFVAGPDAGEREHRHLAVHIASAVLILIGLLATTAAGLTTMIPYALLVSLAGLATLQLLVVSLKEATGSRLVLGPVFAFAVAVSNVSLWNLGSFFWALVVGTVVSILLEREAWDDSRRQASTA